MDSDKRSAQVERLEVVERGRRRRWSEDENYRRQVRRIADPCADVAGEAAQHGDVSLSGRGGRLVELTHSMLLAFDRFIADSMSGHDMLYKLARERMANERRSPDS